MEPSRLRGKKFNRQPLYLGASPDPALRLVAKRHFLKPPSEERLDIRSAGGCLNERAICNHGARYEPISVLPTVSVLDESCYAHGNKESRINRVFLAVSRIAATKCYSRCNSGARGKKSLLLTYYVERLLKIGRPVRQPEVREISLTGPWFSVRQRRARPVEVQSPVYRCR